MSDNDILPLDLPTEERKIIMSDPLDQFKGSYNNYY